MHVALALLTVPLLAVTIPAGASKPEQETQERTAPPDEAKKICKYVTEGAGSRRKKRVCLTAQEWIDFNRGQ